MIQSPMSSSSYKQHLQAEKAKLAEATRLVDALTSTCRRLEDTIREQTRYFAVHDSETQEHRAHSTFVFSSGRFRRPFCVSSVSLMGVQPTSTTPCVPAPLESSAVELGVSLEDIVDALVRCQDMLVENDRVIPWEACRRNNIGETVHAALQKYYDSLGAVGYRVLYRGKPLVVSSLAWDMLLQVSRDWYERIVCNETVVGYFMTEVGPMDEVQRKDDSNRTKRFQYSPMQYRPTNTLDPCMTNEKVTDPQLPIAIHMTPDNKLEFSISNATPGPYTFRTTLAYTTTTTPDPAYTLSAEEEGTARKGKRVTANTNMLLQMPSVLSALCNLSSGSRNGRALATGDRRIAIEQGEYLARANGQNGSPVVELTACVTNDRETVKLAHETVGVSPLTSAFDATAPEIDPDTCTWKDDHLERSNIDRVVVFYGFEDDDGDTAALTVVHISFFFVLPKAYEGGEVRVTIGTSNTFDTLSFLRGGLDQRERVPICPYDLMEKSATDYLARWFYRKLKEEEVSQQQKLVELGGVRAEITFKSGTELQRSSSLRMGASSSVQSQQTAINTAMDDISRHTLHQVVVQDDGTKRPGKLLATYRTFDRPVVRHNKIRKKRRDPKITLCTFVVHDTSLCADMEVFVCNGNPDACSNIQTVATIALHVVEENYANQLQWETWSKLTCVRNKMCEMVPTTTYHPDPTHMHGLGEGALNSAGIRFPSDQYGCAPIAQKYKQEFRRMMVAAMLRGPDASNFPLVCVTNPECIQMWGDVLCEKEGHLMVRYQDGRIELESKHFLSVQSKNPRQPSHKIHRAYFPMNFQRRKDTLPYFLAYPPCPLEGMAKDPQLTIPPQFSWVSTSAPHGPGSSSGSNPFVVFVTSGRVCTTKGATQAPFTRHIREKCSETSLGRNKSSSPFIRNGYGSLNNPSCLRAPQTGLIYGPIGFNRGRLLGAGLVETRMMNQLDHTVKRWQGTTVPSANVVEFTDSFSACHQPLAPLISLEQLWVNPNTPECLIATVSRGVGVQTRGSTILGSGRNLDEACVGVFPFDNVSPIVKKKSERFRNPPVKRGYNDVVQPIKHVLVDPPVGKAIYNDVGASGTEITKKRKRRNGSENITPKHPAWKQDELHWNGSSDNIAIQTEKLKCALMSDAVAMPTDAEIKEAYTNGKRFMGDYEEEVELTQHERACIVRDILSDKISLSSNHTSPFGSAVVQGITRKYGGNGVRTKMGKVTDTNEIQKLPVYSLNSFQPDLNVRSGNNGWQSDWTRVEGVLRAKMHGDYWEVGYANQIVDASRATGGAVRWRSSSKNASQTNDTLKHGSKHGGSKHTSV